MLLLINSTKPYVSLQGPNKQGWSPWDRGLGLKSTQDRFYVLISVLVLKAGHCKRYRATGPHRVTGLESTAWLLPLTETVGGDVSANNWASNVIAWPCEMCGVRGRELGELNVWKGCKLWNNTILTSKHSYEADLWASLKCFSLKIWHLVATILMIFLRINWPNFVQFKQ